MSDQNWPKSLTNNIYYLQETADEVDIVLKIKRISKTQTNRANPNDNTSNPISIVQDYRLQDYRITIFIPYIDYFTSQLTDMFRSNLFSFWSVNANHRLLYAYSINMSLNRS
jgi:hypothetical protein